VRSTKIGSSERITASGCGWFAVTSAPTVTVDLPIRPVIGAVIDV
jgi:hypothetical protein